MATFKRGGLIAKFRDKFIEGMVRNRYTRDFATRCFQQIEGFSTYGFPESHAASFALLVYVSAWIKYHYPEVFAAALLNAQPMGFYAPAQLVRDARDHGVEVQPPDVNHSAWNCTLEPRADTFTPLPLSSSRRREGFNGNPPPHGNRFALRLGLRQIRGFREADAARLVERREEGYETPAALWRRAGLGARALELLAAADAFGSMALDRRRALWAVKALGEPPLPLLAAAMPEDGAAPLPAMHEGEHVAEDYTTLSLTLRRHPMSFLRQDLAARRFVRACDLAQADVDSCIDIAGLVLIRQRPDTASGVIFMTIEDETGVANLIIWPGTFERFRRIVLGARLVACTGRVQREGIVIHVAAERLVDLSHRLEELRTTGFPVEVARGDHVRHPGPEKPRYPAPRTVRVGSRDFR
jgi:error-prone DNA polymerase